MLDNDRSDGPAGDDRCGYCDTALVIGNAWCDKGCERADRLDALVRELADALRPWPSTGKIARSAQDVTALLARVDERTHR